MLRVAKNHNVVEAPLSSSTERKCMEREQREGFIKRQRQTKLMERGPSGFSRPRLERKGVDCMY